MFFGRYLSMIILLAVAGSLAAKRAIPESAGTFKTDNAVFTITLIVIVIIIGALTFLPAIGTWTYCRTSYIMALINLDILEIRREENKIMRIKKENLNLLQKKY